MPGREVLSQAGRYRRRSLKRWAWLFGASLAGGGFAARPGARRYLAALGADLRTNVGEIRQFALSDGTRAWLNTDSAVNLHYSDSLRLVELVAGEILIETAKDARQPARPFEVETPAGRMRALGTRFCVRLEGDRTRLDVFEGSVAVRPSLGGESRIVPAGQGIGFDAAGYGDMETAEPASIAWQRHELVALNMPLRVFLAELGRYVHGYLGCDDAVATLRLVGVYPLDDPDRIFQALENSLPVRVRRPLPWWVRVEPA